MQVSWLKPTQTYLLPGPYEPFPLLCKKKKINFKFRKENDIMFDYNYSTYLSACGGNMDANVSTDAKSALSSIPTFLTNSK